MTVLGNLVHHGRGPKMIPARCSKNVKSQLFSVYVLGFLAAAENIDLANSSNILSGSSYQVHQQRTIMISKDETRTGFKFCFRWRGSFPISSALLYYSLTYFCVSANQCVPIKQNKDSCCISRYTFCISI